MTRYPGGDGPAYEYRCEACGATLPDFQGLYWFTQEEARAGGTVEVPYCPACGAAAVEAHRVEPER